MQIYYVILHLFGIHIPLVYFFMTIIMAVVFVFFFTATLQVNREERLQ